MAKTRTPRRHPFGDSALETMTDEELLEIMSFGYLCADPHTVTFQATPEEQLQAKRIWFHRNSGPAR